MARDSGARGGAETAEAMMGAAKALHELTGEIAAAAYNPRTGLGPGLLESVHETCGASTSNDSRPICVS